MQSSDKSATTCTSTSVNSNSSNKSIHAIATPTKTKIRKSAVHKADKRKSNVLIKDEDRSSTSIELSFGDDGSDGKKMEVKYDSKSKRESKKGVVEGSSSHNDHQHEKKCCSNSSAPLISKSTSAVASIRVHPFLRIPKKIVIKTIQNPMVQKLISLPLTVCLFLVVKKVFLHPQSLENFFKWMEHHPNKGMAAYLIIYPFHMVLFLPGTPLVMGAGYIFKIRFGWVWGVGLCSIITLLGSLVGSIMCFLLGRYCMRGTVRRWSKKYPMFDPIDAGKS